MELEGSCHCAAVRFRVRAPCPVPFNRCYCSICRKTAGGGGYAINLGALAASLEVEGRDAIRVYRARMTDPHGGVHVSDAERRFCGACGSALWVWDLSWPELVHPFASAVDTPLPVPPERVHIMLDSRANWVEVPDGQRDRHFTGYPDESLAEWHRRHGLDEA